ncbi:hypothetical protein F5Y16DRAFT_411069 [Xylariaceae sp. FL0255]|nr:hypothetical protein F5Y16DRAFT_411069 [Xylariaceae sp. FL0255]
MDCGYLDRLDERIESLVNDISTLAIIELSKEFTLKYIPKHFPIMFKLKGGTLGNLGSTDPRLALQILCRNVEEDFYLICLDGEGQWYLQGYIACFSGGFDPLLRIGMSFKDIYAPVPYYEERIANGVDKFVRRMKDGRITQRFNSLQVDGEDLFRLRDIVAEGNGVKLANTIDSMPLR